MTDPYPQITLTFKAFKEQKEAELGRSITWKQIEEGSGISSKTLSSWLKGEAKQIDLVTAARVCRFFSVSPGPIPFLTYEDDPHVAPTPPDGGITLQDQVTVLQQRVHRLESTVVALKEQSPKTESNTVTPLGWLPPWTILKLRGKYIFPRQHLAEATFSALARGTATAFFERKPDGNLRVTISEKDVKDITPTYEEIPLWWNGVISVELVIVEGSSVSL